MAAGGYDFSLDNRLTCSICLEPYSGRQPKILPCFHTFCLPCLTQIADKEVSRSVSSAGITVVSSAGGHDSPVIITCPTCRTPITLPPAGVSALHNNTYVDGGGDQKSDPRPLLCDLCEEGREAKLTCSSCKAYFCTRCRRTHDKLCKSNQVEEVKVQREEKEGTQGKEAELQEVAQMFDAILKKLSGDAQQQQRKAGTVCKKTGSQEQNIVRAGLGQEDDERDAVSITSAVKLLMQKQSDTDKLVSSLQSHVATLQGYMTTLQNQYSLLIQDLSTLQDKNTKLEREQEVLHSEVISLKDKNAILCQDNQQLHHEVTKLQDDITKVQNDASKIQDYTTTTLLQQQDTVQGPTAKLNSQADVQADVARLKSDQDKLQRQMTELSMDLGRLNGDVGNLKYVQGQVTRDVKILSTQVFFQAKLTVGVRLEDGDILICDKVLANVGGGYNNHSGVFTAPVSGVYCFLASATPFSDDINVRGNARIVLNDNEIAYFLARGKGSSTAHVSLSVKAGQQVWLESYAPGNKVVFSGGGTGWFTGFMVQSDI